MLSAYCPGREVRHVAKTKSPEAFGVTVLKAPGGGLVVVCGPIDLSRAESLSPAWTRDVMETRPVMVASEPDNMGNIARAKLPMLTKVGTERIHGESVPVTARRLNKVSGRLLNAALLGKDVAPLELLEALQRTEKPQRKRITETRRDKWLRAERAMDLLGKPDVEVRRALLKAGRSESQVDAYLKERAEFAKVKAA